MKNKIQYIIIGFLGLCLLLLVFKTCSLNKQLDKATSTISDRDLSNQTLETLLNTEKQKVHTQEVIVTDNQSAINKLAAENFSLKKKDEKNLNTIAYYKSITSTRIDSFDVPYIDSTLLTHLTDSVNEQCRELIGGILSEMIPVPIIAEARTPNFYINATVGKDKLTVNELVIPDTVQVRFTETKPKLFKRSEIGVQFTHSNPLIQTTSANSVFYKPKKKSFFQQVILPVAIGVAAGILISK